MGLEIEGIDHVALSVSDIDRSVEWYGQVLGLERWHEEHWGGEPTFVGKGNTGIALFTAGSEKSAASDPEQSPGFLHLAFRTDRRNFERAQEELTQKNIPFSFMDHGISRSIYFSDPDGHELEITTYEV